MTLSKEEFEILADAFDGAGQRARDSVGQETWHITGKLISPIERVMAGALIAQFYDQDFRIFGPDDPFACKTKEITVFCQETVGPYTVDFLLSHRPSYNGENKNVVIECDGHDFHERTKQQAAHDRGRDRWMIANGYYVLRFTGSEIWADARSCAEQVEDFLLARDGLVPSDG